MSSKIHICSKCNKSFSSAYNLKKHNNKKIPCDEVLTCFKCNKCFTSTIYFERHLNRKTPCIKSVTTKDKNKDKEKDTIKILELKHKHKIEEMKTSAELQIKIIESQKQKNLSIEAAKKERKEHTSKIINNQYIDTQNNIQINAINNYIVQLPSQGVVNATLENCDTILKIVLMDLLESGELEKLYYKDINKIPIEIISKTYINDDYPQHKNIWYNKELNAFYCVIDERWNPMDKEILICILRRTFEKYMKMFLKFIPYNIKNNAQYNLTESHLTRFPLHKKDSSDIEYIAKKALTY